MKITHKHVAFLALATVTLHCAAQAPERTPVSDARPLLFAALRSSDGQARGVLTGDIADAIGKRFSASTPIFVDVSTEKRYAQAGCSRLKLRFWQDGVLLPGARSPRQQSIEFGINYCLDGLPPKSLR